MTTMTKPKVPAPQPAAVGGNEPAPLAIPLLRPTLTPRTDRLDERVAGQGLVQTLGRTPDGVTLRHRGPQLSAGLRE